MIKVLQSGMYTSVQDLGRFGYRSEGVPLSGAMDAQSALLANTLVGNTPDKAVLECTLLGPTLQFTKSATVVITGASFNLYLNSLEVAMNTIINVQSSDVLTIGKATEGMRCYIAVTGGIETSEILGSRSFCTHVTPSAILKKGDKIAVGTNGTEVPLQNISEENSSHESNHIPVYLGPESKVLTDQQLTQLLTSSFTISPQSNRMGYLLDGKHSVKASEIITAAVQPGTVQFTPSGKVIVLMRDAQVTGGYARIFQLTEAAINHLSQKRGGETIRFKVVDFPSYTPS